MHTKNGLLREIEQGSGITLEGIQQIVLDQIPDGITPLCGGRSVHFD